MATPAASSSGSQPSAVVPVLQPDGSWAVPVSIPLPDGSSVVQWIPLAGIPAPTASPAATASSPQTAPTSAAVLPAATTSSPPTASTSAAVLPAATTSSPQAASIVAAVSAVTTPSSPQTTSTGASNVAAKSPTAGGKGEKSSNGLPVKQVHSTAGTAVSRNSAQTTSSSSPFSVAQVEASGDTNSKKPEAGPVTEARPAVPSYRAALVGGSSGSSDSKGLTGGVTPRNKGGAGGVTPWQVGVATPQKPNAVTEGTPRKGAARVATPQKGSLGESEAKPVALQQVVEIEEPRQQGAATGSTASLAVGSQEREVALQAEGLATSTSANGATAK
ncbi:unnamed protein product [Amoebophrya sp. A25]|nr:unnamed protein product [Amoebophrya sp. A25]|eukprot:GSA25T00010919001.1